MGGDFYRKYDGVNFLDQSHSNTISIFRLDTYEVTVGRFRQFKAAWDSGYRPIDGAGKHVQLSGGKGVSNSGVEGGYESGWSAGMSAHVAPTDANFACDSRYGYQTWTPSPGANENRPMNCANWYEMYAFCIWDGGFLPTKAEWNYAAAGGHLQRAYPWSMPSTSTTIDCSYASYYTDRAKTYTCFTLGQPAISDVGSFSPKGGGFFGQSDLAGSVAEWALDSVPLTTSNATACTNCAYLSPESDRATCGGSFAGRDVDLFVSDDAVFAADGRASSIGARCARTPSP